MCKPRVRCTSGPCYYHLFNEVAGPRSWRPFGPVEKQYIWNLALELQKLFCVKIIALSVMGTHYHMVVRATNRSPGRRRIIERWRAYYGGRRREPDWNDDEIVQKLGARIANISWFMHAFDQNIAEWINGHTPGGRKGHLWAHRFNSSIIGESKYLFRCLVYVESNAPVAHLCDRPEEYPYCTLARLLGDGKHPFTAAYFPLLTGLLTSLLGKVVETWSDSRKLQFLHRACLEKIRREREREAVARRAAADPNRLPVLGGEVEGAIMVRGTIVGSRGFVERMADRAGCGTGRHRLKPLALNDEGGDVYALRRVRV